MSKNTKEKSSMNKTYQISLDKKRAYIVINLDNVKAIRDLSLIIEGGYN